jgi:hypothetical protein
LYFITLTGSRCIWRNAIKNNENKYLCSGIKKNTGVKTLCYENWVLLMWPFTSFEMIGSFEPARASYICTTKEFRSLMASLALTSPCL